MDRNFCVLCHIPPDYTISIGGTMSLHEDITKAVTHFKEMRLAPDVIIDQIYRLYQSSVRPHIGSVFSTIHQNFVGRPDWTIESVEEHFTKTVCDPYFATQRCLGFLMAIFERLEDTTLPQDATLPPNPTAVTMALKVAETMAKLRTSQQTI